MKPTLWIFLSLLILLIVFLTWGVIVKKKKNIPPDYYKIFIIGVFWLIIGFPLKNETLLLMGFIFLVIGLVNKGKWEKNRQAQPVWKDLGKREKIVRIAIMAGLTVLVVAGLMVYSIASKKGI